MKFTLMSMLVVLASLFGSTVYAQGTTPSTTVTSRDPTGTPGSTTSGTPSLSIQPITPSSSGAVTVTISSSSATNPPGSSAPSPPPTTTVRPTSSTRSAAPATTTTTSKNAALSTGVPRGNHVQVVVVGAAVLAGGLMGAGVVV